MASKVVGVLFVLICIIPGLIHGQTETGDSNGVVWDEIKSADTLFTDDPAVIVFDRLKTRYKDNGSSVTEEEILIQFREASAATDYRTLHYDYNPRTAVIRFLEVKIYRADGETVDVIPLADIFIDKAPTYSIYWNFDMVICPVPRIDDGDSLYYKIERRGLNLAYLYETPADPDRDYIPPHEGYFMDTLFFEDPKPIIEKRYEITGPLSRPLQFATANGPLECAVRFTESQWNYTFSVHEIPGYVEEPMDDGFSECALKLALAAHPSWEEKSRWAYHHNEPQFVISPEMQAEVDRIIADCPDDACKMSRLLHWTAEEIRYLGLDMGEGEGHMVHRTDEIFTERAGVCKDKAAVLISMLRAAGFESYFVLTLAMEQTMDIPADDKFNHGVVAVRAADGKWVFLDPTWAPQNRPLFNNLEQEQPLLIASPEGTDLTHVPYSPPEENPFIVHAATALKSNGDAESRFYIETDGYQDGRFRSVQYIRNHFRRQVLPWQLLEGIAQRVSVTGFKYTDPTDFDQPMILEFQAGFPDSARRIGDTLIFTPILTRHLYNKEWESDYLYAGEGDGPRKHGLELSCTRLVSFHETLTVPTGYELAELPEPVTLKGPTIDLEFEMKKTGNAKFEIHQTIRIKNRITPADEIEPLRKAVSALNEIREMRLIFKRTGGKVKEPRPVSLKKSLDTAMPVLPDFGAKILSQGLTLALDTTGNFTERFISDTQIATDGGRDDFADRLFTVNTDFQSLVYHDNYSRRQSGKTVNVPDTGINSVLNHGVTAAPDYRGLHTDSISYIGVEFGGEIHSDVARISRLPDESAMWEYVWSPREYYPVTEQTLTVTAPDTEKIRYLSIGMEAVPEPFSGDTGSGLQWNMAGIAPYVYESHTGPKTLADPVLILSLTDMDWEGKLGFVRDRFFKFSSEEMKEAAAHAGKLTENIPGPAARLKALTGFIETIIGDVHLKPHQVRYQVRAPDRTLETGTGYVLDRYALLAAFLESMDGKFELGLAGYSRNVTDTVPCLRVLDTVFARITLDGFETLVRLDTPAFNRSSLEGKTWFSLGRDVVSKEVIPAFSAEENHLAINTVLTFAKDNTLTGSLEIRCSGAFNPSGGATQKTDAWIKRLIPGNIQKPEITGYDIHELAESPGLTHLSVRFKGGYELTEIDDKTRMFPQPFYSGGFAGDELALLHNPVRTDPVYSSWYGRESMTIHYRFPKTWQIAATPESVDLSTPAGMVRQESESAENTLIVHRVFKINNRVTPPENYMDLVNIIDGYMVHKGDLLVTIDKGKEK